MTHGEKETPGGPTPEELEAFAWWQERHMHRTMRRRYTRALIAYRLAKLPKVKHALKFRHNSSHRGCIGTRE